MTEFDKLRMTGFEAHHEEREVLPTLCFDKSGYPVGGRSLLLNRMVLMNGANATDDDSSDKAETINPHFARLLRSSQ